MFDFNDPRKLFGLCEAVKKSRDNLATFRNNRTELVREYVGSKYSDGGAKHKVMCNVLSEAVDVTVMHLAPSIPKVLCSTDFQEYKVVARDMEIALNQDFKELGLEDTLKEVALDAWFAFGILKVNMAEGNVVEIAGEAIDVGKLSVRPVSLDCWVHDTTATRLEDCDFFGDRYRLREDQLRALAGEEDVEHLLGGDKDQHFDESGLSRTQAISSDVSRHEKDQVFRYAEVYDIFLPKDQLLITIPANSGNSHTCRPLRVVRWSGPKRGPYHFLSLSDVPENIIPNAPGVQLHELNKWVGNLLRKTARQSQRQKTIGTTARGKDQEDAQVMMGASDGEVVGVMDPGTIKEVRLGGVDQQNQGVSIWLMDLFDRLAGNVRAMGGTGQSADTLGQEQIVFQQLGVRLEKQKQKMRKLVNEVAKDIAWWRWHDQFYSAQVVREVPNTSVQVVGRFGPKDRLGDFINYNFEIDPYSMEYVPPSAKLRTIQEFIANFVLPMSPMMEQQGVALNMEAIIKMAARYSNTPELLDAFMFMEGEEIPRPTPRGLGSGGSSPAVTRREHVRVNRSGGPESPQDKLLSNFLGGNVRLDHSNGNGGVQA